MSPVYLQGREEDPVWRPEREAVAASAWSDPMLWPALVYLALCITLGGASAAGFVANAVLQIAGLIVIVMLLLLGPKAGTRRIVTPFLVLGLAFVAIAIVQLIPLPPAMWSALQGREAVWREYQMLGMTDAWAPLSLSPQGTVRTIVSMIPPLAMLSLTARLTRPGAVYLLRGFVVLVTVSAFVGLLQIGGWEALYFYAITNPGKSVGFFANSNHQATLMLVALPVIVAVRDRPRIKVSGRSKPRALNIALAGAAALVIVCAIATRSLAGVGLLLLAAWGSYLIWRADQMDSRSTLRSLVIIAILALLLLGGGAFFLSQVHVASSIDSTEGNRLVFAADTLQAIQHLGLFGSGLGSFVDVYPGYQAIGRVSRTYVNHAHDDWLEFFLETGILGGAILVVTAVQFVRSSVACFRAPVRLALLARAAVIGILIVASHSLVDYPLRTAAIAAVFGMFCGLLKVEQTA